MLSSMLFDILFLFSVSVIWIMILYQLFLSLMGYRYRIKMEKDSIQDQGTVPELPPVSILIPARNEEIVIEMTLNRMLSLDYPDDKLEIIVINDGSTDNTGLILDNYSAKDERIRHIALPEADSGRGKAHALNEGLRHARYGLIAVYDADNIPEPGSLKKLVLALLRNGKLGAVIGKFRTLNRNRNLLTRFINIETLGFQWILQAGRYHAFQIAMLPGTNCVIRKDVLLSCGGWDPKAITEDSELSIRIYRKGWKIQFVPDAVTWEQEPEKWRTWIRQRTRWVRGNNYVVRKFFKEAIRLRDRFLSMEFLYLFALYYLFLIAIVVSHLIFLFCLLGVISVTVPGPYTAVWISAFLMYMLEIILVLSYENEDTPLNMFISVLMYFTYCQMWIYIVFRSFYLDVAGIRKGVWDKTERVVLGEKTKEVTPDRT